MADYKYTPRLSIPMTGKWTTVNGELSEWFDQVAHRDGTKTKCFRQLAEKILTLAKDRELDLLAAIARNEMEIRIKKY